LSHAFYTLPPSPCLVDTNYAWWQGGFTPEQLAAIVALGESLPAQRGTVFASDGKTQQEIEQIRRTHIAWMYYDDQSRWIYDLLGWIANQLNATNFGFDLYGFVDALQYTVYEASESGHGFYDWHMDQGRTQSPRKLSMVLQLTDPSEYDGGDLEFMGTNTSVATKELGSVHLFPSYVMHRVTPVTRGIRRSLVGWISGPRFR